MSRIVLIIAYFGKFPNYFNLFLHSCKNNSTIDWLIFTDIKEKYDYPKNVKIINLSFDDFKNIVQNKFDFKISLNEPYKLCDYKPSYGYVLEEKIKDYDFWGYCDLDLIFGNIRKFIPDERIELFDKIGHLGHLTIYKNNHQNNRIFMSEVNGVLPYKKVFTSDNICVFDEWGTNNINDIYLEKGKKVWFFNDFYDIYPYCDNFKRVTYDKDIGGKYLVSKTNAFLLWEHGEIWASIYKKSGWEKQEYLYAHFQKRAMEIDCDFNEKSVLCLPDKFTSYTGKIPAKHIVNSLVHSIFDYKRIKQRLKVFRYWVIEKSAPLRHIFRGKK